MERNMSSQEIGDEDAQEASGRRRRCSKRNISPERNTTHKKPKTGLSSNNELYYLNLPSNLINKTQLELCGKIPLIVLCPLNLETINQSLNPINKDYTNTTNLERDPRSEVINKLNNDLNENLVETMNKLIDRSSVKLGSHKMKGSTNASSVESMTLKIPAETSNLEQTNYTGSTDLVSSNGKTETCSQRDCEISKQLSTIGDNNRSQDFGQNSESLLWLQNMLEIAEDENLLKTFYSETRLLRLGINTYKKTFDEFKPVMKSARLKKRRWQLQLKKNRSLITLSKKNKGTQMRVISKKKTYNCHIRERRQFWAEYRKTLVNTDQWKSYVRMFTPGSTPHFESADISGSTDPNLHLPTTSQDLTLLEGGLDFAIVFSEIRRFKQKHQLLFPDNLSIKDQAMASRLVKCMSSFKGSQPISPKSLKDSINYNYNINNERVEVEDIICDVLDNVINIVCITRNECKTLNTDLNITESSYLVENDCSKRANNLCNVNVSDVAPVVILHKQNKNDIVNLTIPEIDSAVINNLNVPDLIKCSNVIPTLSETLITKEVSVQKDELEVNELEKSNSENIKNSNENNNENLSENIKKNEDKNLNEPFIEKCKTSNIMSTECDSQNAIDFMEYYSCIDKNMSCSNVNLISSNDPLLTKNSVSSKEDDTTDTVDVNSTVSYNTIKTNDFNVENNFGYSIDDPINSVLSEITDDAEDNGSPPSDDSYNLCIVTNDDDIATSDTFRNENNEGEINITKKIGTLTYDHKIVDTNEVSEVAIELTVNNHEDNVNIYEEAVNELQQINSTSRTLEDVANKHVLAKIDSPKIVENIMQHDQHVTGVISVEKKINCQSKEDKLKMWNVVNSSGVLNFEKVNYCDSKLSEPVTTDSDEFSSDDSSKPSTISSITHSNLDNMSFSDDSQTFGDPKPASPHEINSELYSNIDVISGEDSNSVCSSLNGDKHIQVSSDVNISTINNFTFPLIKTITVISSRDSNSENNENSLSVSTPFIIEDRENDVENNIVSRELKNINLLEKFGQQNLEHNRELSLSSNSVSLVTDFHPDQENIDFELEESETNNSKNATITPGEFQDIDSDNELPMNIQDESIHQDTFTNSSCNSSESDQSVIFVNRIEALPTIDDKIDSNETSKDSIESKKSSQVMTNVPENEVVVILDDEDMKSPSVVSPIDPILEYEVNISTNSNDSIITISTDSNDSIVTVNTNSNDSIVTINTNSNDSIITRISEFDNDQNQNDLVDNSIDNNTNDNASPIYETITVISSNDSNFSKNETLNSSSQSNPEYQENDAESNLVSFESNNLNSLEFFGQQDFDHNSQLTLNSNTVSLVTTIEVNQENMQYGLGKSEMNIVQVESSNKSLLNIETKSDDEIACNSSEDDPNMQDSEDVVADNSIEFNESETNTLEMLSTIPVVTQEKKADSELALYIEDVIGEISDSESDSLESDQSIQVVETDINLNQFVPTFNNDMSLTTVLNHPSFIVSNKSNPVNDTTPEDPNFELAKSNALTDLNSCDQDTSNPTSTISNSLDSSSDNRSSSNGDSDNYNDLSENGLEQYDSDECNRYSNAVLNNNPDNITSPNDSVQDYDDSSIIHSSCVNNFKPSEDFRQEDKDDYIMVTNNKEHNNFKKESTPHLLDTTATPTNICGDSEVQIKEYKDTDNFKKPVVNHSSNNQSAKNVEEIPVTALTSTQPVKNGKKKRRNVYLNGATHLKTSTTNFYIGDFTDLVNNDDGPSLYADIVATDQPANYSASTSTTSHNTTVTHNSTVTANYAVADSASVTVSPAITDSQTTFNTETRVHSGSNNVTSPSINMLDGACSSNTDFGVDTQPVLFHNRPTYPTDIPTDMYADASVTFSDLPNTIVDPGINDNFRFIENDTLNSFYVDSIAHQRFYNNGNTIHNNPYVLRENNSFPVLNNYSKNYDNTQLPDQFDANEWKF